MKALISVYKLREGSFQALLQEVAESGDSSGTIAELMMEQVEFSNVVIIKRLTWSPPSSSRTSWTESPSSTPM